MSRKSTQNFYLHQLFFKLKFILCFTEDEDELPKPFAGELSNDCFLFFFKCHLFQLSSDLLLSDETELLRPREGGAGTISVGVKL